MRRNLHKTGKCISSCHSNTVNQIWWEFCKICGRNKFHKFFVFKLKNQRGITLWKRGVPKRYNKWTVKHILLLRKKKNCLWQKIVEIFGHMTPFGPRPFAPGDVTESKYHIKLLSHGYNINQVWKISRRNWTKYIQKYHFPI